MALSCDCDISAAFSFSVCCWVCPGGKTCSTGITARERDSHALSTSPSPTSCPGPPDTATVVMSSVPGDVGR